MRVHFSIVVLKTPDDFNRNVVSWDIKLTGRDKPDKELGATADKVVSEILEALKRNGFVVGNAAAECTSL